MVISWKFSKNLRKTVSSLKTPLKRLQATQIRQWEDIFFLFYDCNRNAASQKFPGTNSLSDRSNVNQQIGQENLLPFSDSDICPHDTRINGDTCL